MTHEFITKRIKEQQTYINQVMNDHYMPVCRKIEVLESARGMLRYYKKQLNPYHDEFHNIMKASTSIHG